MGDSDDEHDHSRSRDKFRRERSDYGSSEKGRSSRSDSYRDRRPTTWREDRRRSRDEYEDDSRRRYGRGASGGRDWSPPPAKRTRREWDSLRDYPAPGMMPPFGLRPPWPVPPPGPPLPPMIPGIPRESPNSAPQRHVMLSFKQFLAQQEDTIDEMGAIASYNEYKADFKRKQVEEFFEKHKDEDWFMSLYHPTNLAQSKEESAAFLLSRIEAFIFVVGLGKLDQLSLSVKYTDEIVAAMDAAVIKMEGGNENDLLSLEEEEGEEGEGDDSKESKDQQKAKKEEDGNEGGESDSSSIADSKEIAEGVTVKTEPTEGQVETAQNGGQPKPRALHQTRSVYIRHIPPKISTEDVTKVCKTISGFLRIAFAEATPDKGYERRGWVTYTHGTDIREASNELGTMKVKDSLLSCSVNRELTRRVKQVTAATWTRKAVHSDLQLAVKLIRCMDKKNRLWEHASEGDVEKTNPVLDFDESLLCDEEAEPVAMAVGEEEEGAITDVSNTDVLDENDTKIKLLERLMWYLRIVHSVDYYNGMVFPSEDNMPHRCGIFTVRPKAPHSITAEDLTKYCEEIQGKIEPLLTDKKTLSDSDMEKFGQKDPESEAERFIELNTQKISDNKYLCPLSGKKFKGPEFVKKHIFNKHVDKVEAVKKEAEFFNNYLRDPARPMPLEATIKALPNPKTPSADDSPSLGMVSPLGGAPTAAAAWGQEAQMMHVFGRGGFPPPFPGHGMPDRPMRARGGRRGRGRRQVEYHDLDAPDEVY